MMFPSNRVRVLVPTQPIDFRKGHDGLAALVSSVLRKDPFPIARQAIALQSAERGARCLSSGRDRRTGGSFCIGMAQVWSLPAMHACACRGSDETTLPGQRLPAREARSASQIETCKTNGIEPFAYLKATLTATPNGRPQSRLDELLPWNFKPSNKADRAFLQTLALDRCCPLALQAVAA